MNEQLIAYDDAVAAATARNLLLLSVSNAVSAVATGRWV